MRFIYLVFLWISMIIHSILKLLEVWTIAMYLKLDSASSYKTQIKLSSAAMEWPHSCNESMYGRSTAIGMFPVSPERGRGARGKGEVQH